MLQGARPSSALWCLDQLEATVVLSWDERDSKYAVCDMSFAFWSGFFALLLAKLAKLCFYFRSRNADGPCDALTCMRAARR